MIPALKRVVTVQPCGGAAPIFPIGFPDRTRSCHRLCRSSSSPSNLKCKKLHSGGCRGLRRYNFTIAKREDDLKKLVEQRMKSGKLQPKPTQPADPAKEPELDIRESALVYMDKMMLDSKPAEITLKSGKKKKTSMPYISAKMNPLLRVIIPMREDDESVPEFVRNFDFKTNSGDDIPKVHKDSLGREIRLL